MEYDWYKIGASQPGGGELLPENKVARLTVKGRALFIARRGNAYFAGDSRCPHAGAPLCGGWLNGAGDLVCPLHRFTFSLQSGQSTDGEGFAVQTYPVEKRTDGHYVGLPKKKGWLAWW